MVEREYRRQLLIIAEDYVLGIVGSDKRRYHARIGFDAFDYGVVIRLSEQREQRALKIEPHAVVGYAVSYRASAFETAVFYFSESSIDTR